MELNPRHEKRVLAGVDLSNALLNIIQKYNLSYGETISILAERIQTWSTYLKRTEDKER